ncbi:hydrolase 2, exosortase A system-associated [Noviherbaspirillum sp.]|uniref:hydrolase 2, exosortase A system-associated n=1 Tax=Noviherbaspirillum sp. TaxID=1926288 RepID=UPI002D62918D|nr:hydrolase 2, exosortase A system-associated [Noviherbaspirillum sp.]HZW21691.1 hydrolase 2, exosortase A system-associated [Noviherbaspirillum sp.]
MNPQRRPPALPFFLDTPQGKRFCLYHAPMPEHARPGAILYVHPFGDEMNLSRRMAALQSREFAQAGYGVLQMDLFGCGDSDGDLRDATWETWKEDLAAAAQWLRRHVSPVVTLWGLRLGAALALDAVRSSSVTASQCILWQPVIDGKTWMTQFLRLALAADMTERQAGRENPRQALARGDTVEIGGYELAPALVAGIERIDLSGLRSIAPPLHWFELVPDDQTLVPAARIRTARDWADRNMDVRLHAVTGPSFWATREVTECPGLIAETAGIFAEATA